MGGGDGAVLYSADRMSADREQVIVCGLGHVGYRVTRLLLRLGIDVTAIGLEVRADRVRAIESAGGKVVRGGDARDEVELEQAGIARAVGVVTVTDADLVNLEVALDARRLSSEVRLALRVFDKELARSLEQSLGRARAVGVSALSAPVLAFGALGHDVAAAFEYGDHEIVIGSLDVTADRPWLGLKRAELRERFGVGTLGDDETILALGDRVTVVAERAQYLALPSAAAERARPAPKTHKPGLASTLGTAWQNAPGPLRSVFWVLVALSALSVMVFRFGVDPPITLVEALYFTVTTVTTTGYGDITPRGSGSMMMIYGSLFMALGSVTMAVLYSFATSYVVSEQLRRELGRPPIPHGGHVVVVGIGNVGYRTWAELRDAGLDVVAVDLDKDGELASAVRSAHPFVAGDARLGSTLAAAGVESARALVACTGDDAANLAIALTARRACPTIHTVVRVFDADFAAKLEDGKLVDLAVSTSRVAAPTFCAAVLFDDAVVGFEDPGGLVALSAVPVREQWEGKSPSELGEDIPLLVRDGKLAASGPNDPLPKNATALCIRRRRRVASR